mgnify:FL=1
MSDWIDIKAGAQAYQHIQEKQLTADDIGLLLGASGGPKWFVLQGIDRWMFGDFFKNNDKPLNTLGTSAGAWRFAALGQQDPVAASDLFCQLYSTQTYSEKPDRAEITSEAKILLDKYISDKAVEEILGQSAFRHHFIVARCRGWTASESRRQLVGLLNSAVANGISRRWLGRFYERVIFHHPDSDVAFTKDWNDLPTTRVALSQENFQPAILATGSIPLVLDGVKDIPGAPKGIYRDGGVTDYHFDLDFSNVDGLVLYPHFNRDVIPGWFDKRLTWRRTTGKKWPNVIFISPSEAFIKSLPYGKIPDRTDFANLDAETRMNYWRKAIDAGRRMGDQLQDWVENGTLREKVKLWTP